MSIELEAGDGGKDLLPGAMPTALRGHGGVPLEVTARSHIMGSVAACNHHAHAKPWAWHPESTPYNGIDSVEK